MMGNGLCKPCGASGAATNAANNNTDNTAPGVGANTQQQTAGASSQLPAAPDAETQKNDLDRARNDGKGKLSRLLKGFSASASTSEASGSNSAASGSTVGTPHSNNPAAMEARIDALWEDIGSEPKPFAQVQLHFEKLINVLTHYQHPKSRDEDACIVNVPHALMQRFPTWQHDAAEPTFTKCLAMMKNRAQVFRDRNEALEDEYLVLIREGKPPEDSQVTLKRRLMRRDENKALSVYGYARRILIQYGEEWKNDPRTLPLMQSTLEMAYEQCYLLNRDGHQRKTETWENAETNAQQVFDVLEKALSSEHKAISDLAFTHLGSFKNLMCDTLQKLGKPDTVSARYQSLIDAYKAKHGSDNVPNTSMEDLD